MWRKPAFIGVTIVLLVGIMAAIPLRFAADWVSADEPTYDITTLAGKVASLNGTAGLQIRFSALIEEEADEGTAGTEANPPPINPPFVLSSPLDNSSIAAPNVLVNRDTAAASQNETAIA